MPPTAGKLPCKPSAYGSLDTRKMNWLTFKQMLMAKAFKTSASEYLKFPKVSS
jgi:hypothetical protein